MAGPVDALMSAGFSEDEIGAWTVERRGVLAQAGFPENEIDAYFVGGVTVPQHIPKAFIDRMPTDADTFEGLNKTVGNTIAGRVAAAVFEGAEAGWGPAATGISPEDTKKLRDLGIFQDPDKPRDISSGIRFMNEAVIRPAYAAVEGAFRGLNAGIYAAGATGGQIVAEATSANEAEQARARRDGAHFATVATLLMGGESVGRKVQMPNGEIVTQSIGTIAKTDDFVAAAQNVAGEKAPMAVQEKMLKAYEEKGIHPSELAHDAQTDAVVAQRLLSSDPADLPPGGAPPRPPAEPPAPKAPEPPPEGSFAASEKAILDKISVGESAPKESMTWDRFYTQAVDDLHPIKGVSEDAYVAARLSRGQAGKAQHFLEHGTFDFETLKPVGKPLYEIIEPVAKDLDPFRTYIASKRALEIEASGKKSGMPLEDAQRVVAEGDAKYAKIAEELTTYQNELLGYLKKSGVLTDEAYGAMVEAGKNYVPFYRVFGEESGGAAGKGFGPGNPLKKLKGSERDIIDPLESIIKNTYAYVSVAERNAVGIKIIDALKADGAEVTTSKARPRDPELTAYLKENGVTNPEAIVDFLKTTDQVDGTTISAFRDGVKEQVRVNDPDLVTAFRGLDQQSAGLVTQIIATPAKLLRAGAVLSPDFIVRNVVRDFMTAFINSKGVFSPIDTFKGLKSAITKDADFLDWMKGGGSNSTLVALDRRYLQESLKELDSQTGLMSRAWNVVTNPLAPLRMVSELAEQATRLGEFKKVRGADKASIEAAAFASREVTLDFARIGASMRAYNMITAFGNAQIQGLDRVGRAFIDRPTNTMLKVAGGITLPSVLLWFANKDDERVKELPSWQKDMFWIVATKDHLYRIPKPFELGVVFGSGVERMLDATLGKNPEAFAKFANSVIDIVKPTAIPTIGIPLYEQYANRSSLTDRTLIPADQEKHLPEYQYTPYTTELTKALGKMVSAFPGMRDSAVGPGAPFGPIARATTSPILMENYIRSWTGGIGNYALQLADFGLRKTGVLPDPIKPADTLADIPVVKAFVVRYPSANAQSIQDFYDQHEVNKKFYDTWSAKAKEGDTEATERIQQAGGPMMFLRLDAIKETLGEHSKLVRDITKNETIKADEKRQLIDMLYFNMIEIGKGGKQMIRDSKAALETP